MALDQTIDTLRGELSSAIGAADSEPALDAVRVTALGKKGSVSALLASLGTMSPGARTRILTAAFRVHDPRHIQCGNNAQRSHLFGRRGELPAGPLVLGI